MRPNLRKMIIEDGDRDSCSMAALVKMAEDLVASRMVGDLRNLSFRVWWTIKLTTADGRQKFHRMAFIPDIMKSDSWEAITELELTAFFLWESRRWDVARIYQGAPAAEPVWLKDDYERMLMHGISPTVEGIV